MRGEPQFNPSDSRATSLEFWKNRSTKLQSRIDNQLIELRILRAKVKTMEPQVEVAERQVRDITLVKNRYKSKIDSIKVIAESSGMISLRQEILDICKET